MQKLNKFLHKTYTAAYPAAMRRRNKFTVAGTVVMASIIATGIFGIDTTQATVYQLFALLLALFVTALVSSSFFRARFSATRMLPPIATVGEKLHYQIQLQNLTDRKQSSLLIQEIPTLHTPDFETFMEAREPGESNRNRWDQAIKSHRFQWLVEQRTLIAPKEQTLPVVGASSYVTAFVELEPKRRGYLDLTGIAIKRTDPFGLFKSTITIPLHDRLLILPKRYPIPPVDLPGSSKNHQGGIALASAVGNADEFRSMREYRPGDPIRMLHWKSIAKTGEFIIRENEDEYFVHHALILDTFAEETSPHKFETAVSVAASFACSIRTQESMLDLMFVEDKAYCFSAGRGVEHTSKMLEILACVQRSKNRSIQDLFPLVLQHADQLSGCIFILQTWDSDRQELAQKLIERNIPLKIIVITEGEQIDSELPLQLVEVSNPEKGLATL